MKQTNSHKWNPSSTINGISKAKCSKCDCIRITIITAKKNIIEYELEGKTLLKSPACTPLTSFKRNDLYR